MMLEECRQAAAAAAAAAAAGCVSCHCCSSIASPRCSVAAASHSWRLLYPKLFISNGIVTRVSVWYLTFRDTRTLGELLFRDKERELLIKAEGKCLILWGLCY